MFQIRSVVVVVVSEVRLLSALKLDVARPVREIGIGVGLGQQPDVVIVVVIVVVVAVAVAEVHLAQLDGDNGHGLDGVAAVASLALVERGILKYKIIEINSMTFEP